MQIHDMTPVAGYERVVECVDSRAGYHGIIALHSTVRGPAVGGTRLWAYRSVDEAITDVLRLSRAMSYKTALAGLDLGGGKAVIIGDSGTLDRAKVFRAHGRFVQWLGGTFITAEDVGTSPADMRLIREETGFVAGLEDPSPYTARGVYRAVRAALAARRCHGVRGMRVALQGCGNVGYALARELHAGGATIIASDIDASRLQRVVREFGARPVDPQAIYDADVDVFAPCALGAILNDVTIPRLRVGIVAGAANNQLDRAHHADALRDRGILYVPDYVANAGGVISGAQEICGWSPERCAAAVEAIADAVTQVLHLAETAGITPARAADRMAEDLLRR